MLFVEGNNLKRTRELRAENLTNDVITELADATKVVVNAELLLVLDNGVWEQLLAKLALGHLVDDDH